MENSQNKDKFFFIHIPKTAGTSFRQQLYNIFPTEVVYPRIDEIKLKSRPYVHFKEYNKVDNQRVISNQLICGHFPYFTKYKLSSDYKVLTFLRSPIERTISNLFHIKRKEPKFKDKNIAQILNINIDRLSNRQTKFLLDQQTTDSLTDAHLDEAMQSLHAIDTIGISERYEESIKLFAHKYSWNINSGVHINKNPKSKPELNDNIMKVINDINKLDIELYNEAISLFHADLTSSCI